MQSGVRYRLFKPVRAVKLEEHPGSSLRNPTETLVEIPSDAIVELEGAAAPSGLSNVLWKRGRIFRLLRRFGGQWTDC